MTLRKRLIIYSMSLIGIIGLVAFLLWFLISMSLFPILRDSLEQNLITKLNAFVPQIDIAIAAEDNDLIHRVIDQVRSEEDMVAVVVFDKTGKLLAELNKDDVHLPYQVLFTTHKPDSIFELDHYVIAWTNIKLEGILLGKLAVVATDQRINQLKEWLAVFAVLYLLIILIAIGYSIRYSSNFIKPLYAMMNFSKKVATGGFHERLEHKAKGELQQLTSSLNTMATELENRDRSLQEQRKALEKSVEQLKQAQQELMQSTRLAAVGEMAGRTAHEVLNPVTSIQGRLTKMLESEEQVVKDNIATLIDIYSGWDTAYNAGGIDELMKSLHEYVDDKKHKKLIEEDLEILSNLCQFWAEDSQDRLIDLNFLLREVNRVTHIVDNMRSLTRQSSTASKVVVLDMFRETRDMLSDSLIKRKIITEIECDENIYIFSDPYEIMQVLTNIMRNAMLAIEEQHGSHGGCIALKATMTENNIFIDIKDNGTGINEEHLPFIFNGKFTTRSVKDGTGLGLSISRRLIRGIAGDIKVLETEIGQGTTIRITLPTEKEELPEDIEVH